MMKLSLGFSTCPNDTFIFDALVHQRIDTRGIEFDTVLTDVEDLNKRAFDGSIDITKLSTFAYAHVGEQYQMLRAGAALGFNNGPLLISRRPIDLDKLPELRVAIPGIHTTANFLFTHLFPGAKNKVEIVFSDIEEAINNGTVDAGVIIHETRFTYEQHGFTKLADMGQLWEQRHHLPIPLGCIAIRRSLPEEVKLAVNALICQSVEYAFAHPQVSLPYCRLHAQEMTDEVMQQHISLYVNSFSADLGDLGKEAIRVLYQEAHGQGLLPGVPGDVFIN